MFDDKFASKIEVLSGSDVGRRRHWSDDEKLEIVRESFVGHRQVSATARRYGVSRSLLTIWRRQYRSGELGGARVPGFIPLAVTEDKVVAPAATAVDDRIEIVLTNGRRMMVPARIGSKALARVLGVVDDQ